MKILITENQFKKLIENILIEQMDDANKTLERIKLKHKIEDSFVDNILPKLEKRLSGNLILYVDKNTDRIHFRYEISNNRIFVDWKLYGELNFEQNYHDRIWYDVFQHLLSEYMDIFIDNIILTNLN